MINQKKILHYFSFDRQKNRCPKCGAEVLDTYLRCPECNFKLKINCPFCGKIIEANSKICNHCRKKIPESNK